VETVNSVETRSCPHRVGVKVFYIVNDAASPPVIYIDQSLPGPSVVSLTNQIIRISCQGCFESIRKAGLQRL
jgi:hypothetical protein